MSPLQTTGHHSTRCQRSSGNKHVNQYQKFSKTARGLESRAQYFAHEWKLGSEYLRTEFNNDLDRTKNQDELKGTEYVLSIVACPHSAGICAVDSGAMAIDRGMRRRKPLGLSLRHGHVAGGGQRDLPLDHFAQSKGQGKLPCLGYPTGIRARLHRSLSSFFLPKRPVAPNQRRRFGR